MCEILLSIHPEHIANIFSGTKQYEFRKIKCKEKVDKIILYATYPVMKIVGEADVIEVIVNKPEEVWKETADFSGISKDFFDNYFSNRNKAIAFHLGNAKEYKKPKDLSEYGIKAAPQSFVYIKQRMKTDTSL